MSDLASVVEEQEPDLLPDRFDHDDARRLGSTSGADVDARMSTRGCRTRASTGSHAAGWARKHLAGER